MRRHVIVMPCRVAKLCRDGSISESLYSGRVDNASPSVSTGECVLGFCEWGRGLGRNIQLALAVVSTDSG